MASRCRCRAVKCLSAQSHSAVAHAIHAQGEIPEQRGARLTTLGTGTETGHTRTACSRYLLMLMLLRMKMLMMVLMFMLMLDSNPVVIVEFASVVIVAVTATAAAAISIFYHQNIYVRRLTKKACARRSHQPQARPWVRTGGFDDHVSAKRANL